MAFTGLYSGRKIVMFSKERGFKITRTQTAKQAYSAIIKKYGEIVPNAKYQHKGKGNWVKYSLKNDKKRTGKTTTDIKEWRKQPHKLDFKGKDTKKVSKETEKKTIVYGISRRLRRDGKWGEWETPNLIMADKKKAYDGVANDNKMFKDIGRQLKVVPMYHITGEGVPHNTYVEIKKHP